MILLKDKKVYANCDNKYQEHRDLGYDHYEPFRYKENNGVCTLGLCKDCLKELLIKIIKTCKSV